MALTRVYAIKRGHDGRLLREEGEQFDVDLADPKYKGSDWFAPVNSPKAVQAAKAAKVKTDPKARPPGAGPAKGSAVPEGDPEAQRPPGSGPVPESDMV